MYFILLLFMIMTLKHFRSSESSNENDKLKYIEENNNNENIIVYILQMKNAVNRYKSIVWFIKLFNS